MPTGKEAVKKALLRAAARLFSKRGPAQVSVREIAKAAGVNHGLLHRHFGAKSELVQATLDQLAAKIFGAMPAPTEDETLLDLLPPLLEATQKEPRYLRLLAYTMLEGASPKRLQKNFPIADRMLKAAERTPSALGISAEAQITILLAAGLGMLMFEPYLKAATGQKSADWQSTQAELRALAQKVAPDDY